MVFCISSLSKFTQTSSRWPGPWNLPSPTRSPRGMKGLSKTLIVKSDQVSTVCLKVASPDFTWIFNFRWHLWLEVTVQQIICVIIATITEERAALQRTENMSWVWWRMRLALEPLGSTGTAQPCETRGHCLSSVLGEVCYSFSGKSSLCFTNMLCRDLKEKRKAPKWRHQMSRIQTINVTQSQLSLTCLRVPCSLSCGSDFLPSDARGINDFR